ncbi:MAG TPA: tRNA (N6-threonylcarbamoyladenosine(37)-N6)-methyltransferase TrmO [Nitrososphaerales archaeon]|nr:tRNA (N6-threonylcarbamoyladenosine(37)-N6)-methyltransferase TrmO [Nitrososphaerales archaeon]
MPKYTIIPIGFVKSKIKSRRDAPRFYTEGAPSAFLEIIPKYRRGVSRIEVNNEIIVITWLHRARRSVLQTHPKGNMSLPLTGVFLTRSPDRPNPLGLHRCKVLEVTASGLRIEPIEVINGTPVVDIKPVVSEAKDY